MSEQQQLEDERYRAELDALLETFAPAVDADVMRTLCAGLGIEFEAVVELYWGEPLRRKKHWSDVAKDGAAAGSQVRGSNFSFTKADNPPFLNKEFEPFKFEFDRTKNLDPSIFEPLKNTLDPGPYGSPPEDAKPF